MWHVKLQGIHKPLLSASVFLNYLLLDFSCRNHSSVTRDRSKF